jgi:hypothetical protein
MAPHGIGHAVDRPHDARRREEMRLKIVNLQDCAGLLRESVCYALFRECCLIQQVTPEILL